MKLSAISFGLVPMFFAEIAFAQCNAPLYNGNLEQWQRQRQQYRECVQNAQDIEALRRTQRDQRDQIDRLRRQQSDERQPSWSSQNDSLPGGNPGLTGWPTYGR